MQRILAWGVHLFTAAGAVLGAWALLAIDRGEWHTALLLLFGALLVDSADGALARAVGVSRVLPHFDGRRLDDMVDYLNYAIVPAVFLVGAGSLTSLWWAALPILASAYGFSQTDAKTEDDFFLGFPSYWNVIAIYLWLLEIRPGVGTAIVVAFCVLVFVPIKYLYPSKMRTLRRTTIGLAAVWILVLTTAIARPGEAAALHLVPLSLAYPAFYLAASCWLGGFRRRAA